MYIWFITVLFVILLLVCLWLFDNESKKINISQGLYECKIQTGLFKKKYKDIMIYITGK